jgi:hypothetical protein
MADPFREPIHFGGADSLRRFHRSSCFMQDLGEDDVFDPAPSVVIV